MYGTIGSSVNALRIADCWRSGLGAPPAPVARQAEQLLARRAPCVHLERHEVDEHQQARKQPGDKDVARDAEDQRQQEGHDADQDAVDHARQEADAEAAGLHAESWRRRAGSRTGLAVLGDRDQPVGGGRNRGGGRRIAARRRRWT